MPTVNMHINVADNSNIGFTDYVLYSKYLLYSICSDWYSGCLYRCWESKKYKNCSTKTKMNIRKVLIVAYRLGRQFKRYSLVKRVQKKYQPTNTYRVVVIHHDLQYSYYYKVMGYVDKECKEVRSVLINQSLNIMQSYVLLIILYFNLIRNNLIILMISIFTSSFSTVFMFFMVTLVFMVTFCLGIDFE